MVILAMPLMILKDAGTTVTIWLVGKILRCRGWKPTLRSREDDQKGRYITSHLAERWIR